MPITVHRADSWAPAPSPYLGLRSFAEAERELFHGREAETDELFHLVQRETLTVVFGMSGLGKSSLLRAGLFPRLREAGQFPIVVRLAYDGELVPQLRTAIVREITEHAIDAPAPPADHTLWEYFHRTPFWSARNRPLVPVLVLDQFEELFTLGRDASGRAALLTELADLIENRIPEVLRRAGDPDALPPAFQTAKAKVVLVLREDHLARIEDLRKTMPSIARGRLRLRPMDGAQALRAVRHARTEHLVEPAVAERIVEFVAGARADVTPDASFDVLTIEPALLSLVCHRLDVLRMRRGEPTISADLLTGESGRILDDFYDVCIADLAPRLVDQLEEQLLTPDGCRTTVAMSRIEAVPGLAAAASILIDRRILRIESRLGRPHLEVIHDVLTRVMVARRNRRRDRAARRRRLRRWFAAASTGFMIFAFAVITALRRDVVAQAERQRQAVEQERRSNAIKSANILIDQARDMMAGRDPWSAARTMSVAYAIPDGQSPALAMLAARFTAMNAMLSTTMQATAGVTALTFSGDGTKLLAGHSDGSVSIWSMIDGHRAVLDHATSGESVRALTASRDGRYVVVVGETGGAIWDAAIARRLDSIRAEHDAVIRLTNDGTSAIVIEGDTAALYRQVKDAPSYAPWSPPGLSASCPMVAVPESARRRDGNPPLRDELERTTRMAISGDSKTLVLYLYERVANKHRGELFIFALNTSNPALHAKACDDAPFDIDDIAVDAAGSRIALRGPDHCAVLAGCYAEEVRYVWVAASGKLTRNKPQEPLIWNHPSYATARSLLDAQLMAAAMDETSVAQQLELAAWRSCDVGSEADVIDGRLAMIDPCGEFTIAASDGSLLFGSLPWASYSAIRVSAAARLAATLSGEGVLRVWRLQAESDWTVPLDGRVMSVGYIDNNHVFAYNGDITTLLAPESQTIAVKLHSDAIPVAVDDDALAVSNGGQVVVLTTSGGVRVQESVAGPPLRMLTYSRDSRELLAVTKNLEYRLLNSTLQSIASDATVASTPASNRIARNDAVPQALVAATFVAGEPLVITDDGFGTFRVYNARTTDLLSEASFEPPRARTLYALDDVAGLLALAFSDGSGAVIDMHLGRLVRELRSNDRTPTAIALASGGSSIALASSQDVRLWSSASAIAPLPGYVTLAQPGVAAMAFSPDGGWLATTAGFRDADGAVALWNVADQRQLISFHAPVPLYAVGWSRDGRHLVVGGKNGFVRSFDLSRETRSVSDVARIIERIAPLPVPGATSPKFPNPNPSPKHEHKRKIKHEALIDL